MLNFLDSSGEFKGIGGYFAMNYILSSGNASISVPVPVHVYVNAMLKSSYNYF